MTHIDTLVSVMMLDEGIIPFTYPPPESFDVPLFTLSASEAKAFRRKFRKLWKKAIKLRARNNTHFNNMMRSCGAGLHEKDLRAHHRLYRAWVVHRMFLRKAHQR